MYNFDPKYRTPDLAQLKMSQINLIYSLVFIFSVRELATLGFTSF